MGRFSLGVLCDGKAECGVRLNSAEAAANCKSQDVFGGTDKKSRRVDPAA